MGLSKFTFKLGKFKKKIYNDFMLDCNREFLEIVQDILNTEAFIKLKDYKHHHITRFEHSFNVGLSSYYKAKALGLDYKKAARAGLLHDFHYDEEETSLRKRYKKLKNHPSEALRLCEKYFDLSEEEKEAILHHMYPFTFPYPESEIGKIVYREDNKAFFKEYFRHYKRIFRMKKNYLTRYSVYLYLLIFK